MIDTKKMRASISRIRHIFGDDVRATQSLGEVFELITRLREAEKDAARYRFIRDESTDYHIGEFFSTEVNDRDDCIDEYMKEKGDE